MQSATAAASMTSWAANPHGLGRGNSYCWSSSSRILISFSAFKTLSLGVLSLLDERGRRILVPADKLAYVEIAEAESRKVGFGAV